MARLAGKGGEVTQGGSTIAGIREWSIDYKMGTAETTGFDSSNVKTFLPTISEWSGSFSGHKDGAPVAIGTEVALQLKESQTSTQKWTGQAILTGISGAASVDGLVEYSYTFQGTAALTPPTA